MSDRRDGILEQAQSFVPEFAAIMRAELAQLLTDPQIVQSPVLVRLMTWLVEETLAGRGDKIKSYTVAVNGLGKSEDFDSQSDSYPRVQVGRLRKALKNHYAQHGALESYCLYLQPGSYKMRLGQIGKAYPELSHSMVLRAFEASSPIAPLADQQFHDERSQIDMHRVNKRWLIALLVVSCIGLLSFYLFASGSRGNGVGGLATPNRSPIVAIAPVIGTNSSDSQKTANSISASLADGLSRSWVMRVRTEREDSPSATGSDYRLETQMGDGAENRPKVFFRMLEVKSGTVIWSNVTQMDQDQNVENIIGPVVAQIGGPFGALARRETAQIDGNFKPGYSCLLGYFAYLNSGNIKLGRKIRKCLIDPINDNRLESVRLAFLAFMALDAQLAERDKAVAIQQALTFARNANAAEPKEAYGQFALARVNFIRNDCNSGRRYAQLSYEANPYDPVLLAITGNFLAACGFAEGEALLDKAYEYRVPGESYARLSLILAAIRTGNLERLAPLRESTAGLKGVNAPYHYLCETMIAAALGEINVARNNWKKLASSSANPAATPDELVRPIILADGVRRKVLAFLQRNAVIGR